MPAINGKVDISSAGLPSGDIPVGIAGNDAANISNLINPPEIFGSPGFVSTPFISFNNGGVSTVLGINFIAPGINGVAGCSASPAAAGQVCTPAGSLFNLQNLTSTSSTASWSFSGDTNDSTSRWTGTFISQFNTQSFQDVLTALNTRGFVQNTFSGSITLFQLPGDTDAPEPGTVSFLLLGTGSIACARLFRRFSQR